MLQSESFWNNLRIFFIEENSQFLQFLVIALIFAGSVYYWRPLERKPVIASLVIFIIALCAYIFSSVLIALDIKLFSAGLYGADIFVAGIAGVRLFGLFLFRLILPIFRITVLRIIEDLAEIAGYGAWLMMYLHDIGVNLSGIVTTSAVMTAVLAFSMQDTLGNILGGLTLQLDSSVKIGNWIRVDNVDGRIIDIRWRYTAIETSSWETVIIPNSLLMKGKFFVLGRRKDKPQQWRRTLFFKVGHEHSSGHVIDITQNAVRNGQIPNVADTPPAKCLLMEFDSSSVRYGLRYWLSDLDADTSTDSLVYQRVYVALQRAAIKLPNPQFNVYVTNEDDKHQENKRLRRLKERMDVLHKEELFNSLHDDELTEIAEQLIYTPFTQGDFIMSQGEIANWLYIIVYGVTDVFLELPDGDRRLINTIYERCLLGEMGLMTGEPRSATVIAKSDVLAYRLDKKTFQKILNKRPEIAMEISNLLVRRRLGIDELQQKLDSESYDRLFAEQRNNFLERILGFFRLGD